MSHMRHSLGTSRGRRGCLAGHPLGETAHANHCAFMEAAGDEFVRVACLDLEGYLCANRLDDTRGARDRCAEGRGSQMSQVNFQSNRALVRIEERVERFPRGAFDQPDEPRRAEHGWHAVGRKINDVLRAYDEAEFSKCASGWTRFHLGMVTLIAGWRAIQGKRCAESTEHARQSPMVIGQSLGRIHLPEVR